MLGQRAIDAFLRMLDSLEHGSLELVTPDGRIRHFEGRNPGIRAAMRINDWRVALNLAARGDAALAGDYRAGLWDTTNLQNLLTLGLLNDQAAQRFIFGSRISQVLGRLANLARLNTLRGSRRNIHAHYDLGNDFYALWLDAGMTYSSAIFTHANESLEEAQNNKYDRILGRLDARSGSLLEIGCGWGGFAERATARGDFGIRGITISPAQLDFAKRRLGHRADIALADYRHQTGRFDHIVSIEMFEAVGERYWPTYFEKIKSLLGRGGRAVIQTITIADDRFEKYRRSSDALRDYIFPGGMLPSPSRFASNATRSGLRIADRFTFGEDYAMTLERWLQTFDAKRSAVEALGFDDSFIRLWRFYLAACIAGFRTGRTDVMQVELQHV
ncbi:MAG TPA: cyclopropane-fatty-acyl-phospholipid synthase family protein [Patescibacteria group bacterium]|nr:cyclopropane-fatty-acyl-phospholipid synthase family protein [Patescibacteria group bacterium]